MHPCTSITDLVEAVNSIGISILIGLSIVDRQFTQVVIESMLSRDDERTIIFTLSIQHNALSALLKRQIDSPMERQFMQLGCNSLLCIMMMTV